jgi:hypothetical protein
VKLQVLYESNPWTGMSVLGIYTEECVNSIMEKHRDSPEGHKSSYYIVPCEVNAEPSPLYPRQHEVYKDTSYSGH